MHIETHGSGPALVLIHGWAMHSGLFAPLVRALDGRVALHLVDLPGHGRSRGQSLPEPDALVDALVQRVPSGAVWAGWSLGGLVALQAAQRHPAQVAAVAAIASNPRFVSGPDWEHGVQTQVFGQFAQGLERDFERTIERFLALEAMGSDQAGGHLRELREQVFQHGAPDLAALRRGLELLESVDLRAAVAQLAQPSLWIAGRRDRLVPPAAMRWAAQTATDARYLEFPTGHMPFLADAPAVAQALLELAQQVASR
ncbi:MAG: pimeloyl-ACP methyl ester esterase BioH [Lysobacteraceae bacterium]